MRTIKRTCLQLGFDGGQFTEGRGDHAEQEGGDNIGDKESTHSRDTDGAHQLVVEDDGIQDGLAQVGVESCQRITELRDIGGDVLVNAFNAVVQVQCSVVGDLVVEVQVVDVASQARTECD